MGRSVAEIKRELESLRQQLNNVLARPISDSDKREFSTALFCEINAKKKELKELIS